MASGDVTQLLLQIRGRGSGAVNELLPLVYRKMRGIAQRQVGVAAGGTLNPTALVHEAYLKLVDQTRADWTDRRHFFSVAAMAMRQIVVDHARQRQALKRGGDARRTTFNEDRLGSADRSEEIIAVDEALTRLKSLDERLGQVVEMRFFAGLDVEEIAKILGVSDRTIKRDWRKAKAFLYRELALK